MSDVRFGQGMPQWLAQTLLWSSGAVTGGILKGVGSEAAKQGGERVLPPKPGEFRKETLNDNKDDREALQIVHDAQDYFVSHPDKEAEPLIREKWSQALQGAIHQLWFDRKISGDFAKYILSYKKLNLPGSHLNGLFLQAAKPKDGWKTNLKFWMPRSQKLAQQIERSRQLTDERLDARSLEDRKEVEHKHPPRHRANLNGLTMPDADVEQSAIIGGRLHDSNLDRLKARGFHLTGTYARKLSVKDSKIDLSEWNEMGLPGSNLENTEVYGSNFDYTDFSAHQRRQLPAANMRRFKVVRRRYSEDRAKYNESPTTFKRTNMTGVDLTESEMDQPDMTEAQLGQAKVFRSVWKAPNLTKAGLAGLIGFRSTEFQPVPNTAPYKKHPVLAMAQAVTNSEVNPAWDKWFKQPLRKLDAIARKNHATKRTVMKRADISSLNFKEKNLLNFDLSKAQAEETNFSEAWVGKIPMPDYLKRLKKKVALNRADKTLKWFKQILPAQNYAKPFILTKDKKLQSEIIRLLQKGTKP
jgi:uncharacterized protein YjbI with pentapeptide repeats